MIIGTLIRSSGSIAFRRLVMLVLATFSRGTELTMLFSIPRANLYLNELGTHSVPSEAQKLLAAGEITEKLKELPEARRKLLVESDRYMRGQGWVRFGQRSRPLLGRM